MKIYKNKNKKSFAVWLPYIICLAYDNYLVHYDLAKFIHHTHSPKGGVGVSRQPPGCREACLSQSKMADCEDGDTESKTDCQNIIEMSPSRISNGMFMLLFRYFSCCSILKISCTLSKGTQILRWIILTAVLKWWVGYDLDFDKINGIFYFKDTKLENLCFI